MGRLTELLAAQRSLLRLQREVAELRRENAALQALNDSMRQGMRRCVTCDYRLEFKARQGSAPVRRDDDPTPPQA